MPAVWLLIVVSCSAAQCRTEINGIFADRALCLAEADRLAERYWRAPGFGCQQPVAERGLDSTKASLHVARQ